VFDRIEKLLVPTQCILCGTSFSLKLGFEIVSFSQIIWSHAEFDRFDWPFNGGKEIFSFSVVPVNQ
jgi:hypothetical protein